MEENKIENTEKKKFNKKYLAFGIVGILALMVVSAAVYSYVSNTSQVDIEIERAMQTWIGTNTTQTYLDLGVTHAGDSFNFVVNERNNGNNPAQVYNLLLEVTAPIGTTFNGEEFTSVVTLAEGDVTTLIRVINPADGSTWNFADNNGAGNNKILLMMSATPTPTKFTFGSGVTHTSDITITTAEGIALGTYNIKVCTINNLIGATCA